MTERLEIFLDDEDVKAATEEQIEQAEKTLGIELPKYYKELIKIQDGGYLAKDVWLTAFPTSWANDHVQVSELFGIASEMSILDSSYLIEEWDLPKNIVLISGDGHQWIALDYRNGSTQPSILLLDEDGAGIQTIAPDFHSFINGLTTEDDVELDDENEEEADFDDYDELADYGVFEWDEYILFEAAHATEEMKQEAAKQLRDGRSNEEIKHEMDEVIKNVTANELEVYFLNTLQFYDAELEVYLIGKILHHPSNKVREAVAEHIAACAVRGFDPLSKKDVESFLLAMKAQRQNERVRWFIEQGLSRIV